MYPKWIDEYAKAWHNAFSNMVPASWGPLDEFAVMGSLDGTFLSKLYEAVLKIKERKMALSEVAKCFLSPSSLRAAIYWTMVEYQGSNPKNKNQYKEIIEYLVEVLKYLVKEDLFAYKSNIVHSGDEIDKILVSTKWAEATPQIAKELGKLYTSLSGLINALYRDFFPSDANETYGPYDVSSKFGKGAILIIKHFPRKMRPVELWDNVEEFKHSDVKIFQVYKNISFKCEAIGMHSIYEGDVINNLVSYAVMVDGEYQNDIEEVKKLYNYFAELAAKRSTVYDSMSRDDLKKKVLQWDCYQFIDFFKLARMDWRPTDQMWNAVKDINVADRSEIDTFPSFEEYIKSPDYEVYWLKDLYTNNQ